MCKRLYIYKKKLIRRGTIQEKEPPGNTIAKNVEKGGVIFWATVRGVGMRQQQGPREPKGGNQSSSPMLSGKERRKIIKQQQKVKGKLYSWEKGNSEERMDLDSRY